MGRRVMSVSLISIMVPILAASALREKKGLLTPFITGALWSPCVERRRRVGSSWPGDAVITADMAQRDLATPTWPRHCMPSCPIIHATQGDRSKFVRSFSEVGLGNTKDGLGDSDMWVRLQCGWTSGESRGISDSECKNKRWNGFERGQDVI